MVNVTLTVGATIVSSLAQKSLVHGTYIYRHDSNQLDEVSYDYNNF